MRRRDYRLRFVVVGAFVAVFLFTFLVGNFKAKDETAEAASLANFDAGYIISDYQMGNYSSMTVAEIQNFLRSKNSCNNTNLYQGVARSYEDYTDASGINYNYKIVFSGGAVRYYHVENGHFVCLADETFNGKSAAEVIYEAAMDYRINPQVLIVLLQKEQSLITDSFPNHVQYRSATGYGCPDTAACDTQYYGFRNQVRRAAGLFRTVLDGGWTNYPLGNNYVQYNPDASCGGSTVNIRSLATSALYRYTPYQPNAGAIAAGYGTAYCGAYGNRNFYLYFEDWFGDPTISRAITAPRNITASQNGNNITISWDEPSDASLYGELTYLVVLANDERKEIKVEVSGDKRQYTFENLAEGTYFASSVRAISKSSSEYGRITFDFAIGRAPAAPTEVTAKQENGSIKISWQAPKDTGGLKILKYEVVLADVDKNEIKVEVVGDVNEVVFSSLPMNEYFASSVKAFNAKGNQYARITFSIKNYGEFEIDVTDYATFTDMPADEISKKAISWAVYNGITDKNQEFNGNNALTRRQAMVLLWRFYQAVVISE